MTKSFVRTFRFELSVIVLAVATSVAFGDGTNTFDNASSLNQFYLNGNAITGFTFNPTAGVGGGGGVTSTSSNYDTASAIYLTGSPNTVGSNFYVSLDYKMQLQGNGPDVRVGFTTTTNGTFDGPSDIWAETFGGSNPKNFRSIIDTSVVNFSPVTMTVGNWFQLRLDLTKTGVTNYTGSVTLYDLGINGLGTPTGLATNSLAFGSVALGNAQELYAGFFLFAETPAGDNFSATPIPEPSAFALLALVAVAGVFAGRRR